MKQNHESPYARAELAALYQELEWHALPLLGRSPSQVQRARGPSNDRSPKPRTGSADASDEASDYALELLT